MALVVEGSRTDVRLPLDPVAFVAKDFHVPDGRRIPRVVGVTLFENPQGTAADPGMAIAVSWPQQPPGGKEDQKPEDGEREEPEQEPEKEPRMEAPARVPTLTVVQARKDGRHNHGLAL